MELGEVELQNLVAAAFPKWNDATRDFAPAPLPHEHLEILLNTLPDTEGQRMLQQLGLVLFSLVGEHPPKLEGDRSYRSLVWFLDANWDEDEERELDQNLGPARDTTDMRKLIEEKQRLFEVLSPSQR